MIFRRIFLRRKRGASAIEYGILIGLVALVALVFVSNTGQKITNIYYHIVAALNQTAWISPPGQTCSINPNGTYPIQCASTTIASKFQIKNNGPNAVTLDTAAFSASAPGIFSVTNDQCSGQSLAVGASCQIGVSINESGVSNVGIYTFTATMFKSVVGSGTITLTANNS